MKVLVIGTGLAGGAAVSALTARGHEVVGVSRSSSPTVDAGDPGSIAPASSAAVGRAYVKAMEGSQTGQVYALEGS